MARDPTFETPDGTAVPGVTADQMREVDRIAVDEVGFGLLQMMENAGRTLAETVRDVADGPVTLLAGNGGNGGGGMAAARHLANRDVDVEVVLDREPSGLEGAAAAQHGILAAMDVPVAVGPTALGNPSAIVDALVGYGLSGPLLGVAADLVAALESTNATVVSLDVPSGVDATTGETPGPHVSPDVTHTLALPKTGLGEVPGWLRLAEIGIPAVVYERAGIDYRTPFDADIVALRR